MTGPERVIAAAKAEVGYLEKATNAQLDDKTANAGSGNWTKYARDLDALGDIYNGKKNGYSWCDVFVDWVFLTTFGTELGMELLCQPYEGLGAGCTSSAGYFKKKGQFYTDGPQPGDQVFYTADGGKTSNHTGIVTAVDDGTFYTVEGNTTGPSGTIANGGCVAEKSYPLAYAGIYGFGRPDWSLTEETEDGEETKMETYKTLKEVPAWARDAVQKAIERGALLGVEVPIPENTEDIVIDASYDLCRTLTVLDRLGKLD